ncbi:MAG TPA: N-acetylmuramoyl-L-alanine amidase [Dongiaceae bacterium]|nr:N-acetylmuramoyl-L-alanine amidase [Dongiaceae bacterium]
MRIQDLPSPNFDARNAPIDILLLHYTGMRIAQDAIDRLRDPAAQVSAHYVVDEDGTTYRLVAEEMRAWHAGTSYWAGARDINARSIGIEIVNPGHEFGYRAFPDVQMQAVRALAQDIVTRHAITPTRVIGHSDVAPLRKEDPGELFDWAMLAEAGVGLWPKPKPCGWSDAEFLLHLGRYGYDLEGPSGTDAGKARRAAITAFARHFRPGRLTDMPDPELKSVLNGLIDLAGRQA